MQEWNFWVNNIIILIARMFSRDPVPYTPKNFMFFFLFGSLMSTQQMTVWL